jgi:hypothetical protein
MPVDYTLKISVKNVMQGIPSGTSNDLKRIILTDLTFKTRKIKAKYQLTKQNNTQEMTFLIQNN